MPLLKTVCRVVRETGGEVYIVGGGIKDILLSGKTADIDFAVKGDAGELARAVAEALGGSAFPLGEKGKSCMRVTVKGEGVELDFVPFKGVDINADLRKRDFTVNAMAVSLRELFDGPAPEFIDPLGGEIDLAARRLRLVSDEALREDPLRILRGFRLVSTDGLTPDETFERIAVQEREGLKKVAGERICAELFRTLSGQNAALALRKLCNLGIMQVVIPEMNGWGEIDQGAMHKFRLLEHSLKTFDYMEKLLEGEESDLSVHFEMIEDHLSEPLEQGIDRRAMLKLAALLHDSGKPACLGRKEGKVTFYGHDETGADINRKIASRLKVGRHSRAVLSNTTRHHMRALHLSKAESLTTRAMDRFVRDGGTEVIEILLLALADTWATRDVREVEYTDVEQVVSRLFERYVESLETPFVPLLTGREVMDETGLSEGPEVGRCLDMLREAQEAGEVKTLEEAVDYLKSLNIEK